MNERIQKLAIEAGLKWKAQPPHYTNTNNPIDFPVSANRDLEKFAELLLMECITIMEEQKEYYSKPGAYESREYYERCEAKADAYDDAASSIRYRFGIKK